MTPGRKVLLLIFLSLTFFLMFFFLFKETIESSRSRKQAKTSVYTQLVSIFIVLFFFISLCLE